ncbi:MAG: SOS response-associated peptidase [Thermoplasmata archaeon]
MCFNYSLNKKPEYLEERFDAEFVDKNGYERIYQVSAFSDVDLPVITNKKPGKISFFKWGLVPFWVKNMEQANDMASKTKNARAESIFEKPAFRAAAGKRRCLILADGFFEWREVGGKKYPYYIKLKNDDAFAFAGVWERWNNKAEDTEVYSYSLVTTEANPLLANIHNTKKRMPVILIEENEKRWLESDVSEEDAKDILVPYPEDKMEAYTISKIITDTNFQINSPEVLEPHDYPELNTKQEKLF